MTMTVEHFIRKQLRFKKNSPEWKLAMSAWRVVEESRKTWLSETTEWARRHCTIKGKNPGLGWKMVGPRGQRRVVPDYRERRIMLAILEWRRQGFSWREIYDHLRHPKTRTRKGKVWSVMRIRRGYRAALALEALEAEPAQRSAADRPEGGQDGLPGSATATRTGQSAGAPSERKPEADEGMPTI